MASPRTLGMPLSGTIVADFTRVLAGPLTTATLADLGATVIKVEQPGRGDETREWGPPWTADSSAYFEAANRSKLSIALDLSDPDDNALARRLMTNSDIVVENFKTGALDARGLGYEQVATDNPGIIYCSVTGFGSALGRRRAGYDFLVQAVGGLMSITGEHDGGPTKVGVALVDVLTAKDATLGILAALRIRDQTGQGQRVEVNLLSSLLAAMANQSASYLATGTSPTRMGNAHPSIAPYELLMCEDEHLAIACGNDAQFRRLVGALGSPSLADDSRFANNGARVANRPALRAALEQRLAMNKAEVWAARLTNLGVPAGCVGTVADGFKLASELGLNPLVSVGTDAVPQVRHPVTYSETPVVTYAPPPRLNQHSDQIRKWLAETGATDSKSKDTR